MPIAAGITAAGSLGSALIGSNAAQQASSQQVAAQQQVMAMLQQTLGPLISQGQGIAGQGQNIMQSVLPTLTKLLTPGPSQTQTLSQLPGFQFAQDWGQKAATNMGTTMGLGGNTIAAGANYATGLAQKNFGNYVGQLQNLFGAGTNVLTAGTGLESGAANALAGGSQSALTGIGNAQAAGTLGSANALSSGISGLSNSALLYGLGNKLNLGGGAAPNEYATSGGTWPSVQAEIMGA